MRGRRAGDGMNAKPRDMDALEQMLLTEGVARAIKVLGGGDKGKLGGGRGRHTEGGVVCE